MNDRKFQGIILMFIVMGLMLAVLTGCVNYGQSVMVSKGRAGVVQAVFGTQAEFCKVTTTKGVTLTDQDHEAFQKYCAE